MPTSIDERSIWHELRVSDLQAGAWFYGELFSWTTGLFSMGAPFCAGAIGGASAVKPRLANHWPPDIGTTDVDTTARLAVANSGIVTSDEPADVVGQDQIAPILDLGKSIFEVFGPLPEVTPDPGQQAVGRFVGDRLCTPDTSASTRFHEEVLGSTVIVGSAGRFGVGQLSDGTRVGELVTTAPGEPTGWLPFVLVDTLGYAPRTRLGPRSRGHRRRGGGRSRGLVRGGL